MKKKCLLTSLEFLAIGLLMLPRQAGPTVDAVEPASSAPATPSSHGLERFHPMDTARFQGTPDPVHTVKAFPNLKFTKPLAIRHAADGTDRMFIVDQGGTIHVFPNRPDVKAGEKKIFLDVSDRVTNAGMEEGLLGLAFHPQYKHNGQFFVFYSVVDIKKNLRESVVARFRVSKNDPNQADRSSEETILRYPHPFENHNGGNMVFGHDGHLYIAVGDGGSANDPFGNGQSLETFLGKTLRIDVDHQDPGRAYAIPKDNPFAKKGGKVKGEIWAYGLRNIWQLCVDRSTGALWASDVGQDRYEEIDVIVKGGNYGWKVREGLHPFDEKAIRTGSEFIDPVYEYDRSEGRSITGGLVYRGSKLPELVGNYFYGDWVTGNIWALSYDGKKATGNRRLARTALPITGFGEDEAGEAYFVAFDGYVYRFEANHATAAAPAFPRKLSESELFLDVKSHQPAPGLIPYSVNVPLWSDYAAKERFMVLPAAGRVVFSEKGQWEFPVGSILVKTFSVDVRQPVRDPAQDRRRLETRLLVRSSRGWDGYTYQWNASQTDASLLESSLTQPYDLQTPEGVIHRQWYFPSRNDCFACHTKTAGFVLGLNTRQLNRTQQYGEVEENQLRALERIKVFSTSLPKPHTELESFPAWGSSSGSQETLARAYLDVNCAMCHAPGGTGNAKADLRFHTPLTETFLIGQAPGQASIGPTGSLLIAPGDPRRSEVLHRMMMRGPRQMPLLASNVVDWDAIKLLGGWIENLPPKK